MCLCDSGSYVNTEQYYAVQVVNSLHHVIVMISLFSMRSVLSLEYSGFQRLIQYNLSDCRTQKSNQKVL
jgi:hypothetical protein